MTHALKGGETVSAGDTITVEVTLERALQGDLPPVDASRYVCSRAQQHFQHALSRPILFKHVHHVNVHPAARSSGSETSLCGLIQLF